MRNRMPQRKPEMQREAPFGQACGDQSWQPHWYSAFEDITGSVPAPKAHPKGVAVTREGTTLRGWKWLAGHDGCILRGFRVSKIVKRNPSFCWGHQDMARIHTIEDRRLEEARVRKRH